MHGLVTSETATPELNIQNPKKNSKNYYEGKK
jgi:hypothetical protein